MKQKTIFYFDSVTNYTILTLKHFLFTKKETDNNNTDNTV